MHLVLIELILIAKSYCRQQDIFCLVTDQTNSEDSFTAKRIAIKRRDQIASWNQTLQKLAKSINQ
jgi:hypothetical protein